jgi:very-short-patch-repair endonuclease
VPIEDARCVFAYGDLGWPEHKVVVEFDGMLKYDGTDRSALCREKLRQERIEQAGWIVVRLTWHDVVHDSTRSIVRLREAFARAARTSLTW